MQIVEKMAPFDTAAAAGTGAVAYTAEDAHTAADANLDVQPDDPEATTASDAGALLKL